MMTEETQPSSSAMVSQGVKVTKQQNGVAHDDQFGLTQTQCQEFNDFIKQDLKQTAADMGRKYNFDFLAGEPTENHENDWAWAMISAPDKKEEIECTIPTSIAVANKKLDSSSIFNNQNNASMVYSDISRSTLASSNYSSAVSDFFRNSSSVNMNSASLLSENACSLVGNDSARNQVLFQLASNQKLSLTSNNTHQQSYGSSAAAARLGTEESEGEFSRASNDSTGGVMNYKNTKSELTGNHHPQQDNPFVHVSNSQIINEEVNEEEESEKEDEKVNGRLDSDDEQDEDLGDDEGTRRKTIHKAMGQVRKGLNQNLEN